MRRFYFLSGLGLAVLLLFLGLIPQASRENHVWAGGAPAVSGAPLLTPAASPSPTSAVEPALAILDYVVGHHPSLSCGPIGGPPNARMLTCTAAAGHETTGYVFQFASEEAAATDWQGRRASAQAYFPYFSDVTYYGYPAYDAHDERYPYAYWDNYLWGSVWVMGARRHDDTHFRYAPDLAPLIYDAAIALGYLGNPTPTFTGTPLTATATPTRLTPTATLTSGPQVCEVFNTSASAGCTPPATYTYSFSFWNITCPVAGNVTVSFAVAPTDQGPWTVYDSQSYPNHFFPVGVSSLDGTFTEPNIPDTYGWFEVWIGGFPGPPSHQIVPHPLCNGPSTTVTATAATSTPTPTLAPTLTPTPAYVCEVETIAGGTTACQFPDTYAYDFTLYSSCWYSMSLGLQIDFQVAPDAGGPWATYDRRDLPMSVPPGETHIQGSFVERAIPARYHAYRITLSGVLNTYNTRPGQVCATSLPTVTPCPVGYSDVPSTSAFYPYINCLACRGLISGYADGSFRPYAPLTRGQVAKIVAGAAAYSDPIPADRQSFADVPPANPFWLAIERIYLHGDISGYSCGSPAEPCDPQARPYFRPSANVTRGQLAKLAVGARGWPPIYPGAATFADVPPGSPFYPFVEAAVVHAVISGYDCSGPGEPCDGGHRPYYRPNGNVTRGQAAKIIANTFFPGCLDPLASAQVAANRRLIALNAAPPVLVSETPTPTVEPELAILQYVLAQHSDWNCQGLSGTPGHRQLNDCHPFGYFSHPTTGSVDNYGSPGAASAAWQARRTQAQSYPIFADESYGGYPGYHAGDTNYPYAHYENYFWGDVWVMGGVSSDDTQFRGSPYMASAIFQAALALGYLGTPTPTVTGTPASPTATYTSTPTVTPTPFCEVFPTGSTSSCTSAGVYNYSFSYYGYGCPSGLRLTVYFYVGPTAGGPWTVYDQASVFHPFTGIFDGSFTEPNIPAPDAWYTIGVRGQPGPSWPWTTPQPICAAGSTVTATPATETPPPILSPSSTPSATATPIPPMCEVFTTAGSPACTAPDTYSYNFSFWTYSCSTSANLGVSFAVAPTDQGPWTVYDTQSYPDHYFPPGSSSLAGSFVEPNIPGAYRWFEIWISGMPGPPITQAYPVLLCPACAISYSDVPPGHPFYPYVCCLACRGILSGYADGTFRPYASLTRGQVAKIVAGAAGYSDPISPTQQTFADVPPGQPFWLPIEQIAAHGLSSGYSCGGPGEPCDGQHRAYFRPGASVTRGQLAKIDAGARGYSAPIPPTQQTFADVPPSAPFWLWVEQVALHGVVSGYSCGGASEPCDAQHRPYYRPNGNVTRGQAAKIIANTFFPGCQAPAP